ncbi:MAG: poly-gamma-glutamate biosynthesis protein PgsC [Chitinophagales bacterium]
MTERAIGFGLAINLLLTEVFGLPSGGLVVPGYLALFLGQPWRLLATLAVSLATWALVRYVFSWAVILYGRRRFSVAVLTGFLLNALLGLALRHLPPQPLDVRAVGYIVPGLLANEMLAAGPLPAAAITLAGAALVRLLLFLTAGWGA